MARAVGAGADGDLHAGLDQHVSQRPAVVGGLVGKGTAPGGGVAGPQGSGYGGRDRMTHASVLLQWCHAGKAVKVTVFRLAGPSR